MTKFQPAGYPICPKCDGTVINQGRFNERHQGGDGSCADDGKLLFNYTARKGDVVVQISQRGFDVMQYTLSVNEAEKMGEILIASAKRAREL